MTTPTLDTLERDAFNALRSSVRTLRDNPGNAAARLAAANASAKWLALMFGEELVDAA